MSNCGTSKVAQRCLRRHSFAQDSLAIGRQRTAGGPACRLLAKGRELLVQCFGAAPEGTPAGAASPPVGTGLGAGCVQELCEGGNVPAPPQGAPVPNSGHGAVMLGLSCLAEMEGEAQVVLLLLQEEETVPSRRLGASGLGAG